MVVNSGYRLGDNVFLRIWQEYQRRGVELAAPLVVLFHARLSSVTS